MNRLFTYGYGGKGRVADLIGYAEAGCRVLDIRLFPIARDFCWDRSALIEALPPGAYQHCRDLGNRNMFFGPIDLWHPEEGFKTLLAMLMETDVVLLCGCKDVARCHRSVVAAEMQRRLPGLVVVHLAQGQQLEEVLP